MYSIKLQFFFRKGCTFNKLLAYSYPPNPLCYTPLWKFLVKLGNFDWYMLIRNLWRIRVKEVFVYKTVLADKLLWPNTCWTETAYCHLVYERWKYLLDISLELHIRFYGVSSQHCSNKERLSVRLDMFLCTLYRSDCHTWKVNFK